MIYKSTMVTGVRRNEKQDNNNNININNSIFKECGLKITIGDVKCLSHLGTEQIDGFRGEPPPPEGGQREQSGVVPVPERATDCVYKYGKSVMFSNDSCTKYKMFNPRLHTYM